MVLPVKGDIIRFPRKGYSHFGIYVGDGRIIHRAGPPGGPSTAPVSALSASGANSDKAGIREDSLEAVAGENTKAEIFNFLDDQYTSHSPDEIVRNARSMLGDKGYNILFRNCQHFATWCRYGQSVSQQVADIFKSLLDLFITQTKIFYLKAGGDFA